jgi:hypothetical protein
MIFRALRGRYEVKNTFQNFESFRLLLDSSENNTATKKAGNPAMCPFPAKQDLSLSHAFLLFLLRNTTRCKLDDSRD